jgi:hypothetical protein
MTRVAISHQEALAPLVDVAQSRLSRQGHNVGVLASYGAYVGNRDVPPPVIMPLGYNHEARTRVLPPDEQRREALRRLAAEMLLVVADPLDAASMLDIATAARIRDETEGRLYGEICTFPGNHDPDTGAALAELGVIDLTNSRLLPGIFPTILFADNRYSTLRRAGLADKFA